MKYIEAFSEEYPSIYEPSPGEISLFLAGGISNCRDWQAEVVKEFQQYRILDNLVILNPRRKNYPMNDPAAVFSQIKWEYDHLQKANTIMFWFAPETLCPITLFEYGKWLVSNKMLFVGCDPEYKRLEDVKIQTGLERPFQQVHTELRFMLHDFMKTMDDYL